MASPSNESPGIYGLMAMFEDPTTLVAATEKARDEGYSKMNCYTPYPVAGAWEAIGHETPVSKITLAGGLVGCIGGFSFITWTQTVAYPWNIAGRPTFSWPAFIPPTFETTILFAGLSAAIGMILINGLPQHYHPVFNVPSFKRASSDRYFLVIESEDEKFDREATEAFLQGFNPEEVSEVEY
ncbi:MAG: DUF3341 domain-containing protein [Acidobacteriota bacterium]